MKKTGKEEKAQVVYFSHGGGPLPILGDESHKMMIDFMTALPSRLEKPDFILVISAHWEEKIVTLLGADKPSMFYDYYGFPSKAYEINYPAPGSPEFANEIVNLLQKSNIPARIDYNRGFDHGLFIPLKMMYPDANIPAIQISLLNNLNPSDHIFIGNVLGKLKNKKILIIGSGFSFHNLSAFSWEGKKENDSENDRFQNWLIEVCTGSISKHEREQKMINWEKVQSARYCHPREDHLLPLHVCIGIADEPAKLVFDDYIMGKRALAFLWQ